jgi:Tol biopolymer transport system component
MFLIPPTGGQPTSFGDVDFQAFTPDSSRVLYTRVVSDTFFTDLFSAQSFGGDERNLSKLDPAGSVFDAKVSPDGKWIVFQTQIDGRQELRVSDGAQAQPPTATPTVTPTPTNTPTSTPTSTPTLTPTPTLQPGQTPDRFEEHLPVLKNEK